MREGRTRSQYWPSGVTSRGRAWVNGPVDKRTVVVGLVVKRDYYLGLVNRKVGISAGGGQWTDANEMMAKVRLWDHVWNKFTA